VEQEEPPQLLQELPPMGVLTPDSLLEKEAHLETALRAIF
jgi:hypothetical protein